MTLRNVIVMLVLAALAALAWFYVQDAPSRVPAMPATIPEFVREEVLKIVATMDGKPAVYRRRTDRTDAWELELGNSVVRADANAIDELLLQLVKQDVKADIARGDARTRLSPADLEGYGLAATKTSIELHTSGSRPPLLVRYGKRTTQGSGVYVDTGDGTDIWVVGTGAFDQLSLMAANGARSNRVSDLRAYDVAAVEIVKAGVTQTRAERRPNGTWRFTHPYSGWADPLKIDEWVSKLVNVEASWDVPEGGSAAGFGLEPPYAEVQLTPKRGGDPAVTLIGAEIDGGGVFVQEKGRAAVGRTSDRLRKAADTPALELRDRSFSRLGIDGASLRVRIGEVAYELRKEGSSWVIAEPKGSGPADDERVRAAMEAVRSWRTVEFLDKAKPEDHGITEKGDFVEVELMGANAGKVTLRIGAEGDSATRYGRRTSPEDEGGVERVEGAPFDLLAKGWLQFRRRTVRDFGPFMGDLVRLARDQGTTDAGKEHGEFVVERSPDDTDPEKRGWHLAAKEGPGVVGTLDTTAVSHLIGAVSTITATEWLHFDSTRNAGMGFQPPLADTLSLSFEFRPQAGSVPGGLKQLLLVGKRRPEGGHLARFAGDDAWAFVLPDDLVKQLLAPVTAERK